jgi:hypothetical protein
VRYSTAPLGEPFRFFGVATVTACYLAPVSRQLWIAVAGVAVAGVVVFLVTRGGSSESSSSSPGASGEQVAERAPEDLNAARRSGSLRPVWERKAAAEAAAAKASTKPDETATVVDASGTSITQAAPAVKGADTAMHKIRPRGGDRELTDVELDKLVAKYERTHGPMSEADKERFAKTISRIRRPTTTPTVERVPGQRKLQDMSCTAPDAQERYKAMTAADQEKMRQRCQAHGFVPPQ